MERQEQVGANEHDHARSKTIDQAAGAGDDESHMASSASNVSPREVCSDASGAEGRSSAAVESPGTHGEVANSAVEPEEDASDTERLWSAVIEIDPGFPFMVVWPALKGSVFKALRAVHGTWPEMGWRSGDEMEASLQQSVETSGFGAIARGLCKSQAGRVVEELNGEVPCSVRFDRAGAAAAPDISQAAQVPSRFARASPDDHERRERIRQRIRELQDGSNGRAPTDPMFADILSKVERDIERDERWFSMAHAMERVLDLMQAASSGDPDAAGRDPFALLSMPLRHARMRGFTVQVERERLLSSALWPILGATPDELRQGRLRVKYRGEEGEDGEGGGGVCRAFLTHAGGSIADPLFGLLLPAVGGYLQLSPIPGLVTLPATARSRLAVSAPDLIDGYTEDEEVLAQPESWCRFLGRLLGIALVHECPLGFLLVPPLCKQLLGQDVCFDDLFFVPGLSDNGGGWYRSLRNLLAHHAPQLVPADPTLQHLDAKEVDSALFGLEAVMPSRTHQIFDALETYVGGLAESLSHLQEALELTASLVRAASTESQHAVALSRALEISDCLISCRVRSCELPTATVRAGHVLAAALCAPSCDTAGGSDPGDSAREISEQLRSVLVQDAYVGQEVFSVSEGAPSELKPLRPQTVPSAAEWFTTGAKGLMRSNGKFYHEVLLDRDFFDTAPQLGWLTEDFVEKDYDANGVGDDEHGFAADGARHKKWHNGDSEAKWPRDWEGGDVVGFALDIDGGLARFSLNGEWIENADMQFESGSRALFPAASMKGRFLMHIPKDTWRFSPPGDGFSAWADSGVFKRPVPQPVAEPKRSLERCSSHVGDLVFAEGCDLSADNLPAFAEAVMRKALTQNMQPYLDAVVEEFRRVVPQRLLQGLTWQQLQDRISGQRLCHETFIKEWRARTTYQCCDEDAVGVALWWCYVSERSEEELRKLFSWCTGFASVPVTSWKFQIKLVDDSGRCPTINTCMTDDASAANRGVKMPTLYLPTYDSTETLAHKMEWALSAASSMNLH
jgi:hypothetical protein